MFAHLLYSGVYNFYHFRFDIKDLDTVYREGSNNQISPRLSTPAVQFFGKSVQHRTVQNPDGVEILF